MLSVLGFLVILAPLVIFHEFGHYFFARLFGVKAEIFSIGFGPRIWSRQRGETEWRVSAIPLGGYVKLLGEDREADLSPEELKRALHKQEPWKRFWIFFGGPLFNFIYAVVVFMVILVIGEPQVASVVGRAVHQSAAERAGFQSGDQIVSINGAPVIKFEEVLNAINDHPAKPMQFEVVHPGSARRVTISVTPAEQDGFSVYGEQTHVGEIDGLLHAARSTQIGISNPHSLAGQAGVKSGDSIVELNGVKIASWEQIESTYAATAPKTELQLKIQPEKAGTAPLTFVFRKPNGTAGFESVSGMHSSELFVAKAVPGSPAESAGVKAGDRLIGVGPQVVQSFFELKDAVQRAGEHDGAVPLQWEREGKIISARIKPTATTSRDPLLKKTTQFTVGVVPMLTMAEPVTVLERVWNPFTLVYKATERMVVLSWRNFMSIRKMFTGDVSVATLGGPIMIGKIAGESLSRGLIAFLTTMGILSVGLGVLNILPVPVLDGGHLLLLLVEIVRRKPLTLRQMEVVQGVGLVLILGLMGIVIRNDIARLPFFD